MSHYTCIRDCYVNDRLWKKGEVYDLPDNMVKSQKNFSPMEQLREISKSPEPEVVKETTPVVESNPLKCSVCGKECKTLFGLGSHKRIHK